MAGQITADLREYNDRVLHHSEMLEDIADRIDEEHAKELAEIRWERNDTLATWLNLTSNEELEKLGVTRLPADAEGETWHVGDMAERSDYSTAKIVGIALREEGWRLNLDDGCEDGYFPDDFIHHRLTPAERIRAWVEDAKAESSGFEDLLAIADELEGGAE